MRGLCDLHPNIFEFISLMEKLAVEEVSKKGDQTSSTSQDLKSPLHDIQNRESSVFDTPPSSTELERTLTRVTKLPAPERTFLGLELEEERSIRVDFITEFASQSLEMVVGNRVFRGLSDLDLLRSSHVSTSWRDTLTRRNILTGRRIRRFLLHLRKTYTLKGKENRPIQAIQHKKEPRPALGLLPNGDDSIQSKCTCGPSVSIGHSRYSLEHLNQKVPSRSPRSENNNFDFSDNMNSDSCQPKDFVVGSKASKKRLKRLSLS